MICNKVSTLSGCGKCYFNPFCFNTIKSLNVKAICYLFQKVEQIKNKANIKRRTMSIINSTICCDGELHIELDQEESLISTQLNDGILFNILEKWIKSNEDRLYEIYLNIYLLGIIHCYSKPSESIRTVYTIKQTERIVTELLEFKDIDDCKQ